MAWDGIGIRAGASQFGQFGGRAVQAKWAYCEYGLSSSSAAQQTGNVAALVRFPFLLLFKRTLHMYIATYRPIYPGRYAWEIWTCFSRRASEEVVASVSIITV